MPHEEGPNQAYTAVAAVIETIAEVERCFDREIERACKYFGCDPRFHASLFGAHTLHGRPLGGADWNREVSLFLNGNETQFVFDVNVDHNTHEVEVKGMLNFQGTYGYDTLRNYSISVVDLDELKSSAVGIVKNMFSQLEVDLPESKKRSDDAPPKGQAPTRGHPA